MDEKLTATEDEGTWTCCICGEERPVRYLNGHRTRIGMNNPAPILYGEGDECCGDCNAMYVIPARMAWRPFNDLALMQVLAERMKRDGCTPASIEGVRSMIGEMLHGTEEA